MACAAEVPALEERKEFSVDGITYEAFNTSGGVGCRIKPHRVERERVPMKRQAGSAGALASVLMTCVARAAVRIVSALYPP